MSFVFDTMQRAIILLPNDEIVTHLRWMIDRLHAISHSNKDYLNQDKALAIEARKLNDAIEIAITKTEVSIMNVPDLQTLAVRAIVQIYNNPKASDQEKRAALQNIQSQAASYLGALPQAAPSRSADSLRESIYRDKKG